MIIKILFKKIKFDVVPTWDFSEIFFLAFNVKYGSYSPKELYDCFHCYIKTIPLNFRDSSKEYILMSRSNTDYCDLNFNFFYAK